MWQLQAGLSRPLPGRSRRVATTAQRDGQCPDQAASRGRCSLPDRPPGLGRCCCCYQGGCWLDSRGIFIVWKCEMYFCYIYFGGKSPTLSIFLCWAAFIVLCIYFLVYVKSLPCCLLMRWYNKCRLETLITDINQEWAGGTRFYDSSSGCICECLVLNKPPSPVMVALLG